MHHGDEAHKARLDRRTFVVAGAVGFCSLPGLSLLAADANGPIRLSRHRQLFFENRIIASSKGLNRVWHRPTKFAGNPVLRRARAWEGYGPNVYGSVMAGNNWVELGAHNRQERLFKMWYVCYVGGRPDYWACYATSRDGTRWDRPALNVVSDPRLPAGNNVVMLGSGLPHYRHCNTPSVLYRPEERDPQRRYAMLYWDTSASGRKPRFAGVCLAFSPDGIRWTNVADIPVFPGSDIVDSCYDPIGNRYLLYYKMWRVQGEVVASEGAGFKVGNVSYWIDFDATPLPGGRVRIRGSLVNLPARSPRAVQATVELGGDVAARVSRRQDAGYRVVCRAESQDLIHWSEARPVFELPQKGDPAGLSTYGMSVFPYEGLYLGLLRVFHNEREIDVELAYSNDERNWKRATERTAFIGRGPAKSHDAGMVFSANAPVAVGNELWFYYGAFTGHHAVAAAEQHASICLAKLRRDGFVSLDAGQEIGELTTVPFQLEGRALKVNAAAEKGELTVEVRDPHGQAKRGFTFADCTAFHGDAVTHEVTWRGGARIENLKGQMVQLVFRLRQGQVYAFQVAV